MTQWFDRLNLPPTERRLVLFGLVVAVVLLNYFLIWPYFGEWNKVTKQLEDEQKKKSKFMAEIAQRQKYEARLEDLKLRGVPGVLDADRVPMMQQTVYAQGGLSGVSITRVAVPPPIRAVGSTNQFFDERLVTVDVNGAEADLVDFLVQLGSGDSMMRVRDLSNLRPDPTRTRLQTTMTLVASFQKDNKPAAKPATSVVKPAAKPAAPAGVPLKGAVSSTANNSNLKK
jgi:Tfp pilus assembly protein PilO